MTIHKELAVARTRITNQEGKLKNRKKYHLIQLVVDRTKALNEVNKKLLHQSSHDSLTNLPNRYSLEESLQTVIDNVLNKNIVGALLFIDVDNFKVINDTYGHSIGDEVLIKFSERMSAHAEKTHMIARLGGDEFAVLLSESTMERATQIAEAIRAGVEAEDFELKSDISINITTSIGIVKIDGSETPQRIFSFADTALYVAKGNGRNRVANIESLDDQAKLSVSNQTVHLIKKAIKHNRFVLHYQPITKAENVIVHYEALLRMLDEEGNIIFPNEFIPIAERFGFMSQIDRWVMKNALKTLEEHPNIHIFINLSGVSLGDKALLSFIEKSLEDSTIDPARLGFEITETAAIRDLPQSRTWIKRIKLLGCKFALDDFGVGFSSFSYLSDLPVDYLKIDGSFVRDLDKDPTQKALIRAINALAHELGKETIAEFVENQAILMILQDLRVDCCQGYYIGTPKLLDANLCIYKENVNSRREMECG